MVAVVTVDKVGGHWGASAETRRRPARLALALADDDDVPDGDS